MANIKNFATMNNSASSNRADMHNSAFESPFQQSEIGMSIIDKNLDELTEFCSFIRFYPDIFWDMYKPETGGLNFDLYQRVMMRQLSRFTENYFCIPRGGSKTLIHVLEKYHAAVCYPNITLGITSTTKENAVKIWKEKHDEIVRFYPSFAENFKSVSFAKDSGRVEFTNGAVIDNLANSQTSKGLRRRRGGLEESALIDKDLYEDAIEPIFNVPRTTMSGEVDPLELNGQINRFSTSGNYVAPMYSNIYVIMW